MTQVINTNIASLNAQMNLSHSQGSLQTSLQRLSSGMRINSAKDDAAGLSISDRMTSQITGLDQAVRNANDAISLSQTAEGALNTVDTNLQRVRQLALQSANSTNSSSDRAALNAEAQSLITEIQRVSSTTQFNGLNLLDGSFNSSQFQVGANANQTISVSTGNATTSALGSWGSTGGAVSTANAWTAASTISINGTSVGASVAQNSVAGWTTTSAAAKAAAVNAQTSVTGVTATAASSLSGVAPLFNQTLNSGDLSINGIAIGPVAAGSSATTEGANVASAINLLSNTTGVTATADSSTGKLTLTTTDGRDIKLSAATSSLATRVLDATGLTAATVTAPATALVQTATFAAAAANLSAGSVVTLNGVTFSFATGVTSTVINSATSVTVGIAGTIAAETGTALAVDMASAMTAAAAAGTATQGALGQYTAVGSNVTGTVTITNAKLGSAATTGDTVIATSTIASATIAAATGGADLTTSANSATTGGTLSLSSTSSFTLSGTGASVADGGLTNFTATQSTLSTLSINSISGSNTAITTIDAALAQVNSLRASLGATQNRFASTVANLQTTSQNISAARSRIQDTDFASETANLTRSQILQQAGVAMLSQANALPNLVLSLLK